MSERVRPVNSRRRSALRWFSRRESGQAAIEFILIIPTFIIFLMLTVDFGMLAYEYVSAANAVREGARYGATNCGTGTCSVTAIQDRTIARSGNILSSAQRSEITVGWVNENPAAPTAPGRPAASGKGDAVVVRVDHMYNFMFMPGGPGIPVVACADMRLERNDSGASFPAPALDCSHR